MKNLYFSTARTSIAIFCITIFSTTAFSQVTIDQNNFPREVGFTDTLSISMQISIAVPTEGPNQSWDYSPLAEQSVTTLSHVDATSDVNFPNATNHHEANLTFQGFFIGSNTYEGLDANGWYDMGRATSDTIYSISGITGGATDSLRFVGTYELFDGRINFVKFPMTYQSQWTESYEEEFDFEITVLGFGLNKAPGQRIRVRTDEREVVGHGNLKIPTKSGASDDIECLLLKVNRSVVDSYFLAGNPAPPTLLTAFGLTQGDSTADSFYVFYAPDYGAPVMNLDYSATGTIESAVWRPSAASKSTGIQEPSSAAIEVYPNPVTSGSVINIASDKPIESLRIMDIGGKTILEKETNARTEFHLKIPQDWANGSYLIEMYQGSGSQIIKLFVGE